MFGVKKAATSFKNSPIGPFCYAVLLWCVGADDSKRMLRSDSQVLNVELMNSPPLSDRNVWMTLPVSLRRRLL